MDIYQISSYIYDNTGSAIDTEVVNGICPDDTIEVSRRDGKQFLALGFDPHRRQLHPRHPLVPPRER